MITKGPSAPYPDRLNTSRLAVFTDFDGTLVDLAERPTGVAIPSALVETLVQLDVRLGHAFAIISGRPIATIDGFLAPARFAMAGAHGTERRRADGTLTGPPPAIIEASNRIGGQLLALAASEPELILEQKQGAIALHYRQAPQLEARCRAEMTTAVDQEQGFVLIEGKMVLEARAQNIDKGAAIRAFMAEAPFVDRTPVFLGDDITDEDGFAAVQKLGGVGIKIGEGKTLAIARLDGPLAVRELLARFGDGAALSNLAKLSELVGGREALIS